MASTIPPKSGEVRKKLRNQTSGRQEGGICPSQGEVNRTRGKAGEMLKMGDCLPVDQPRRLFDSRRKVENIRQSGQAVSSTGDLINDRDEREDRVGGFQEGSNQGRIQEAETCGVILTRPAQEGIPEWQIVCGLETECGFRHKERTAYMGSLRAIKR